MADELELHFTVPGQPESVRTQWREQPPEAIREGGFQRIDESYNSITWEARFLDWPGKLVKYGTFGVGALFGDMDSIWRLTARFDADGHTRTRVSIIGKASDETRAALERLTDAAGTVA